MSVWKKLNRNDFPMAESFLREREPYCVSAVSRFYGGTENTVWAAFDRGAGADCAVLNALLLYHKRLIFPVFNFSKTDRDKFKTKGMPLPSLAALRLLHDPLYAAQGLGCDMDLLESALEKKGVFSSTRYEYDLLDLNCEKENAAIKSLPGLVIRRARAADVDALFPLQAAYEKEEVLPPRAVFNPAASHKLLEELAAGNWMLAAEYKDRLVGKININARSYNRFQIGGVYVLPEYRSRGIARAMTASLIRHFAPEKTHASLFVKKANIPARRAYDSLGFVKISDYRITYFE